MPLSTLVGLIATALACLCIYAASPNQKLLSARWPAWPARTASAVLLLLGWLALAQDLQRLAATFVCATMLMLALVLLPYLGALFHARSTR